MILTAILLLFSFSCQPGTRNRWLCCSISSVEAQSPSFTCPLGSQTPVTTNQGQNQFCTLPGQRGDCPQNALCLSAANSPSLYICCLSQTNNITPVCPNNAIPQPSTSGYVACVVGGTSTCDFGYSCVRAANDFSIQMCCSATASQNPTCPGQQSLYLDLGRPRYCLPSQLNSCPSGYACQLAVSSTGTYVCCTVASAPVCPSSFTSSLDSRGDVIYCSPNQPAGCPSGAVCLQSSNSDSLFLCCRSAASPRVCPNNQNALLTPSSSLETCTGPGASCSRLGYSCQLSTILAQYICCGQDSTSVVCADGRETFIQTSGQPYTCNALTFPTGCPIGYDCAQSTQSSITVCCRQGSTTTLGPPTVFPPQPNDNLRCPAGWNPHKNEFDDQPRVCSSPLDNSCPIGYSCTPSSVAGLFLCCRLATSPACPRGTPFLMNSQTRLCSRTRSNQCPRGYSCEQSTNPSISICCTTTNQLDETILCSDRSRPAYINGNIRSCSTVGSPMGCPDSYLCERSNKNVNICCAVITRLSALSVISSRPRPSNFQCPNGVDVDLSSTVCTSNDVCKVGTSCQKTSNVPGISVCCALAVPPDTRCLGRRSLLVDGVPLSCVEGDKCPRGYECSSMTSNRRAVCCEDKDKALEVCSENRAPYIVHRSDSVLYCDDTAYTCPDNYECKPVPDNSGRFACCSQIPKCPQTNLRSLGRCFNSSDCLSSSSCMLSTVDDLHVCCPSTSITDRPVDDQWVVIEG